MPKDAIRCVAPQLWRGGVVVKQCLKCGSCALTQLYKQRFLDASELPEELRPKPALALPPKPGKEDQKKKKKKKKHESSSESSSSSDDSSDDSSSSSSEDSESSSSDDSSSSSTSSGSSSSDDDSSSSSSSGGSSSSSSSSSSGSDDDSSSSSSSGEDEPAQPAKRIKTDRGVAGGGKTSTRSPLPRATSPPLRTEADRRSREKVERAMMEDQPNYAGGRASSAQVRGSWCMCVRANQATARTWERVCICSHAGALAHDRLGMCVLDMRRPSRKEGRHL